MFGKLDASAVPAASLLLHYSLLMCGCCAQRRWPEDLAPGSVVLLSGKDDLMDAAEVKDMLDVAGHVKVSLTAH
jgi:hypothetical protein